MGALFLPASVLAAGPALASALAPVARPISFRSLGQPTQTLSGYNPTVDVFVPLPGEGTIGPNSTLTVVFSQSALLDPHTSTVSIYVNNANIAGELLNFTPGVQQHLTVRVPRVALTSTGANHIEVMFSLHDRTEVARCGTVSPNLNVTLYGSSTFQYDLLKTQSVFHGSLDTLPSPFASASSPIAAPILVGLPSAPNNTELTAAGRVLARFGEDLNSRPPAVHTVGPGHLARAARGANLLLVGTPRDLPVLPAAPTDAPFHLAAGAWRDHIGHPLPASEGILYESANPWDRSHAMLVLTGNSPAGVQRTAGILGSGTLRRLLHGDFALVPTAPALPPATQISGHVVPLSALGYNSITVEGFGEHDTRFSFDLAQRTARSGQFDLVFSHGGVSPSGTSSVRIDLNGQPVASRLLQSHDPFRVHWNVTLPANELVAGQNAITVRFFLVLPATCSIPPSASSWATIVNSSTIYLPSSGIGGSADLSLLPFPLVKDGSPDQTLLVVPNTVSAEHGALHLCALIGAQSTSDAPLLTVSTPDQLNPRSLRRYTVLLDGLPSDNSLLAGIDAKLPVHLAHGLRISASSPALRTTLAEHTQLGIIEEIPAPWGPTRTAVIVSASTPSLLPLTGRKLFRGLSGTVATVAADGTVQSFDTRPPLSTEAVQRAPRPIVPLAMSGLAALILLTVLAIFNRRRLGTGQ